MRLAEHEITIFVDGMVRIVKLHVQGIVKYGFGFIERDIVLCQVVSGFRFVPFIFHKGSISLVIWTKQEVDSKLALYLLDSVKLHATFLTLIALEVPDSDRYYPAEGEFLHGRTDSLRQDLAIAHGGHPADRPDPALYRTSLDS